MNAVRNAVRRELIQSQAETDAAVMLIERAVFSFRPRRQFAQYSQAKELLKLAEAATKAVEELAAALGGAEMIEAEKDQRGA